MMITVSNDALTGGTFDLADDAMVAWADFGHLVTCENPF